MEDIYVRYADMPCTIRSYVILRDDVYTIIINSRLNDEMRKESYEHELRHIKSGDFSNKSNIGILEFYAHHVKGE